MQRRLREACYAVKPRSEHSGKSLEQFRWIPWCSSCCRRRTDHRCGHSTGHELHATHIRSVAKWWRRIVGNSSFSRCRFDPGYGDFHAARMMLNHRQVGGDVMDFIERIFGVSPDGGNGSFEIVLIVILTTLAMTVVMAFTRMIPPTRWGCAVGLTRLACHRLRVW